VGEGVLRHDAKQAIRYLRASHSILGGVWTGEGITMIDDAPFVVDEQGIPIGDYIQRICAQEATRLVNSTGKSEWDNALIM
jgi:hypothetical protein